MPADSSTIRTVPGGKAGPEGGCPAVEGSGAAMGSSPPRLPTTSASTTALTTPSTPATIQAVLPGLVRRGSGSTTHGAGRGAGGRCGASTGDCWTATPGPAGVATSDHADPLHQRTIRGVPSGSGYQPGGGAGCP